MAKLKSEVPGLQTNSSRPEPFSRVLPLLILSPTESKKTSVALGCIFLISREKVFGILKSCSCALTTFGLQFLKTLSKILFHTCSNIAKGACLKMAGRHSISLRYKINRQSCFLYEGKNRDKYGTKRKHQKRRKNSPVLRIQSSKNEESRTFGLTYHN